MTEDQAPTPWRISSWSNGTNCVEVAVRQQSVHVRDSQDRGGETLSFATSAWQEFTEDIRRSGVA